jgi:hypothetical protein
LLKTGGGEGHHSNRPGYGNGAGIAIADLPLHTGTARIVGCSVQTRHLSTVDPLRPPGHRCPGNGLPLSSRTSTTSGSGSYAAALRGTSAFSKSHRRRLGGAASFASLGHHFAIRRQEVPACGLGSFRVFARSKRPWSHNHPDGSKHCRRPKTGATRVRDES